MCCCFCSMPPKKGPKPEKPQPEKGKKKKRPGKQRKTGKVPSQMSSGKPVKRLREAMASGPALGHLKALAYGIALPEASKPLRLPDRFPQESRVLGLTQSKHLELLVNEDTPEYGDNGGHAMFVATRQPSRLLMMRTIVPPNKQYVFFQRGSLLSSLVALDPMFERRTRSAPEHTGPTAISVSPFEVELPLPVVGCCTDVHELPTSDPGLLQAELAPGAVFEHVGVAGARRGLYLCAGQRLDIHVHAMADDGIRRPFTGAGLAPNARLRVSTGDNYSAEPWINMGSVFECTFRLVPMGGAGADVPTDYEVGADGKDHYPDGMVAGSSSTQVNSTSLHWHAVTHLTGYYQVLLEAITYNLVLPAGATLQGGFPPIVASVTIDAGMHPIRSGQAAPTARWVSITPDDLNGSDVSLLERCRVTGVGVLVKNLSNVLQTGGMFYGRRTAEASPQSLRSSALSVQSIERSNNSGIVKAHEGLYTWLPPTADDEVYRHFADRYGVPLYYVEIDSPQHLVLLQLPGDSVSNASLLAIQNVNLEFVTQMQRYGPADITQFGTDELSRLRHAMCRYPLFMDNPIHVRKLLQALKDGVRGGAHYLKHNQALLQPMVSAVNPAAGEVFRMMRTLLLQ